MSRKRSKKTKLLVVFLLEAALMVASTGFVAAGTQGSDCLTDNDKVLLYENGIGDTSDGDDRLWRCGNTSNLDAIAHTLPGDCKGFFLSSTTWNDCVSSYRVWVPAGWHLTFYSHANYGTWFHCLIGPLRGVRFNVPNGWNDTLSSFKWILGSACP
jgi:hypothetical protein